MWLSKRRAFQSASPVEVGMLTINSSAVTEAIGTMQSRNSVDFSPYGYSSCAPVGESVLLLNSTGGVCRAGVKMPQKEIGQGEIEIESLGGAKISLLNDGSIVLNKVIIKADGTIINKDGDEII